MFFGRKHSAKPINITGIRFFAAKWRDLKLLQNINHSWLNNSLRCFKPVINHSGNPVVIARMVVTLLPPACSTDGKVLFSQVFVCPQGGGGGSGPARGGVRSSQGGRGGSGPAGGGGGVRSSWGGRGGQGSHRHWKTWKNETTFSSQGKVREF